MHCIPISCSTGVLSFLLDSRLQSQCQGKRALHQQCHSQQCCPMSKPYLHYRRRCVLMTLPSVKFSRGYEIQGKKKFHIRKNYLVRVLQSNPPKLPLYFPFHILFPLPLPVLLFIFRNEVWSLKHRPQRCWPSWIQIQWVIRKMSYRKLLNLCALIFPG